MDNITHSLIGLAAGEAWSSARKKKQAPLWIASMLANNIPDIDVPLGSVFLQDSLSRLLSHRGYSHTLLLAPIQGLIVFFLLWLCYRKRSDFPARDVLAISLLGPFLHIFADSWNSYGVHPFWPFHNEWFYGDFVFILEPWVWVIVLPALFFATSSKILRSVFAVIGGGIVAVAWINDLVPPLVAGMLSIFLVGFLLLLRKVPSPGKRISCAISAIAIFLGTFSFTSRSLAQRFAQPGFELALSPYPGNPFCWTAHSAGFMGDEYQATVMRLAPWPKLFPVQKCPLFFSSGTSAPLEKVDQTQSPERIVLGLFRAKKSELEALGKDCQGDAFLRFARIPFWKPEGSHFVMGDLRFDRGGGRGFATAKVDGGPCPDFTGPWIGRFSPEHSH
ncbi:MAG: metal-dependent hydrolase [Bacteriovoracia bacterium]